CRRARSNWRWRSRRRWTAKRSGGGRSLRTWVVPENVGSDATRLYVQRPPPEGRGLDFGVGTLYGRASSSLCSASSSLTLMAKVSSDTRIWRALVRDRKSVV